jgi:hypothetical protein
MILSDLHAIPFEDPSDIIRLRDSIYAADLFVAAVGHFDFFTILNKNPLDFESICRKINLSQRPCDVMLTYFKALNLITEECGIYRLTKLAEEFLITKAEWNLIPYISTQTKRPTVDKMLNILCF